MTPEIQRIVRHLKSLGWRIRHNKHYVCFPPDPKIPLMVMGTTISNHRAINNIKNELKRRGVDITKINL